MQHGGQHNELWQVELGRYNHRDHRYGGGHHLDNRNSERILVMDEDFEEMSECCGSHFVGEVIYDLGICAACKEWASVYREEDDE